MTTDTGPVGDAGPGDTGTIVDDGGRDGGGGGSVCDSTLPLTLAAGPVQHVMGDTTTHTTGLVTLGANCGGQTAGAQMAEQVIALTLPGSASDNVTVSFSLLNDVTGAMFDTTTELRTSCTTASTDCFDDSNVEQDYRSDGVFNAPGGSTRFLVITGYRMPETGYTNVGPWQADFTTFVNPTPPVLASATATLVDGNDLSVHAMGTDAQSAASGIILTYLDSAGTPIGLDLDADPTTPAETELGPYGFTPSVAGMMTFDGTSRITGWGDFATLLTATQLRVSVADSANLTSNELTIALVQASTVHVGAVCDATHVCATGVDCTGTPAMCTVPAAVATACTAATAITVATPTTATTMATAPVTLTTGMGVLEGSCQQAGGDGDERIFSVMVPAGTFDLIAETTDMGMGMDALDTLVYDRTVCGDPSAETGCDDDRSMTSYSSLLTVQNAAAGAHFIVVDAWATLETGDTTMTTLTVRLRPVLAAGATCDPAGTMNRCAGAACPTTGTAVCP